MKRMLLNMILYSTHALALEIAPPQITGTNAENGATTREGVYCLLCEGRNAGTVEGVLSVKTNMLGLGTCLQAYDHDGHLLVSCPLRGENRGDATVFWFILKKDFLAGASLTIFTEEEMCVFPLKTVVVSRENYDLDAALERIEGKTTKRPIGSP